MLRYVLIVLMCVGLSSPVFADGAQHGLGDHPSADFGVENGIEIFGRSLFLLRISEKQRFEIRVHNHLKSPCVIDLSEVEQNMAKGLRAYGFYLGEPQAEFVMFLEVYGEENPMYEGAAETRCLGGYRVAFMKQYHERSDNSYVLKTYDYEPTTILMLKDGIFDVEYADLARNLDTAVVETVHRMVLVIEDIRTHYKDR